MKGPADVQGIRIRVRSEAVLRYAIMASAVELQDFIDRQRILLAKEREAEIERSSLLLSNCGPKILEQKGLSLGGLGVVGMHVGLGGKTYAFVYEMHTQSRK